MSGLERAEAELRRAGLFDKDSDYAGMIGEAVMRLMRVHLEERHSGFSNGLVVKVFSRVASGKTLSPITNDPAEWNDISDMNGGPLWQNNRDSSFFSEDGGKTGYQVDDRKKQLVFAEPKP